MSFHHVIVEVHSLYDRSKEVESVPEYCKYGVENTGYHCLYNNCPYVGHALAPYEIAFGEVNGEVADDAWIGFGGDMEPDGYSYSDVMELKQIWTKICKEKISEAYKEYMLKKSHLNKSFVEL